MTGIESAYENACKLAGKNYTRVTFEHAGMTYTVEPVRLARKLQELEKWQPIETAPKDGTPILLGSFNAGNSWCASDMWRVDSGRWLNHEKCKTFTHWKRFQSPDEEAAA